VTDDSTPDVPPPDRWIKVVVPDKSGRTIEAARRGDTKPFVDRLRALKDAIDEGQVTTMEQLKAAGIVHMLEAAAAMVENKFRINRHLPRTEAGARRAKEIVISVLDLEKRLGRKSRNVAVDMVAKEVGKHRSYVWKLVTEYEHCPECQAGIVIDDTLPPIPRDETNRD
jgi:hypothetical protein